MSVLRVRAGILGFVVLLAGCPMGGDSSSEDCGDDGQAGGGAYSGGTDNMGRRAQSYPGVMDGQRVGATSQQRVLTMATPVSRVRTDGTSPVSAMQNSQIRGVTNTPNAVSDVSASCGDGSAFICSPGGCCGPGVTSTPSACCPTACCTNTVYCDYQTGGCGYACQAGEQDCGDGTCCPSGTTCSAGACLAPPACAPGTQDCGNGTCCPGGTTCDGFGGCEMPGSCEAGQVDCGGGFCCDQGDSCAGGGQCETMECSSGQQDCGDGYCCAADATCVGGGQCEEPGCEPGMNDCGDYCCEAGDVCAGGGQCDRPCEPGEQDCGELCCPSGTRCGGSGCEPLEQAGSGDDGEAGRSGGVEQPGGGDYGDCDEAALRAALGGFSSGNACVDGCIDDALVCAGRAGCVLTSQCQNAETACVQGCF